jgi:hypothetical protein
MSSLGDCLQGKGFGGVKAYVHLAAPEGAMEGK